MCILLSAVWLMAGCSVIDDDLSNCPTEEAQYQMEYELKLVTNMTTELQTQLTTITELSVASALETHLENIFSDFAHDVNLSFYDTDGAKQRLEHRVDIINTNQTTYDLTLPMRKYLHLAVANIADDDVIGLFKDDYSPTSMLQQIAPTVSDDIPVGVVASHNTGLFTARQPMEVLSGVNQTFNVRLYMANCAATLVIDPQGHSTEGLQVFTTGFATRFNICDSTYVFPTKRPIIRTNRVEIPDRGDEVGFCSVTFPSPEPGHTRTIIETEEPFIAGADDEALWEIRVYVPHENDTKDEYVLGIKEPIRAGQFKIIRVKMGKNGEIISENPEVGVSVTLDWKPGGEYNPEL